MLYWALIFFIIAVVAGILGFGGIASTAAGIAQVLFFIFIVIFAVALIMGLARRGPPINVIRPAASEATSRAVVSVLRGQCPLGQWWLRAS